MIELFRKLGYMLCNWIDDKVDEFNDFNFTENDF